MDWKNREMNEKIEKIHNFLRENAVSPATPKIITLSDFEFNFKEFKGSFTLKLDSDVMKERFDFGVEIDGSYGISPPFHISPLGVPASYPAIELTEETSERIEKLINDFFPKVKPFGIDKISGEMIDRNTPIKNRAVDVEEVFEVINKLATKGFSLRLVLNNLYI
jgi:hypothetical protein